MIATKIPRHGDILFRYRSYIPFVLLVPVAVALESARTHWQAATFTRVVGDRVLPGVGLWFAGQPFGTLTFFALRGMKKHTCLLDVVGR